MLVVWVIIIFSWDDENKTLAGRRYFLGGVNEIEQGSFCKLGAGNVVEIDEKHSLIKGHFAHQLLKESLLSSKRLVDLLYSDKATSESFWFHNFVAEDVWELED